MTINEIELLADVKYEFYGDENTLYKNHHAWTSLLSGSTFCTKTTGIDEVIKQRNEIDFKFRPSALKVFVEENVYELDKNRLNKLKTRLNVMLDKRCWNRLDNFCDYMDNPHDCDSCEHCLLSLA